MRRARGAPLWKDLVGEGGSVAGPDGMVGRGWTVGKIRSDYP